MQKILGNHWKSSPKHWLLSLCLRPAADHGPYVAWQTELISEHAGRTETLSHAPVKAWLTSTPGGKLICYNLLVLVSKSLKRGGGDGGWRGQRMNLAGVHPRAHCHGLRALMGWTVPASLPWGVPNAACGTGPHFSPAALHPQADVPATPSPGTRLMPRAGGALRHSPAALVPAGAMGQASSPPWSPDTIHI